MTDTTAPEKTAQQMTKKEMLALPDADWTNPKWWNSILIIPLRTKHDSGYAHIALVGVDEKGIAREVLTACSDDIEWPLAPSGFGNESDIRTDAYYPSGVLKLWSRRYEFRVSHPVSTARIECRKVEK